MGIHNRIVHAIWVSLIFAGLLLVSCGTHALREKLPASPDSSAASQGIDLQEVLAEISDFPTPADVDPEVFSSLRIALIAALQARGDVRVATKPPSGESNVPVISVESDGGDGWNLTWGYYNAGDYDQNGDVSIGDITPIAIHFGHEVGTDPLDEVIDGSGDDEISIADITPVAVNFGTVFSAYAIQGANLEQGPYQDIAAVTLAEASGEGRKTFSLPPLEHQVWARVVAEDNESVRGVSSEPIRNESPADYPVKPGGYVGAERCLSCHGSTIDSLAFYDTAHMQANRDPNEGAGVIANFTGEVIVSEDGVEGTVILSQEGQDYFATVGGTTYKVIRTIGGGFGHMQTYVVRIGHSDYLLPIRWIEPTGEWAPYHLENWFDASGPLANVDPAASFERRCIGCHSSTGAAVGFNESTGEWLATYLNLQNSCERCHGPGQTHANAPSPESIFLASDFADGDFETRIAVCAQCHSNGSSVGQLGGGTIGYPWNSSEGIFTPGSTLAGFWDFVPYSDEEAFWAASNGVNYAREQAQQYLDFAQSRHFELQFGCWTCHDTHEPAAPFDNSRCTSCHLNKADVADFEAHTQHTSAQIGQCIDCHMPFTAISAIAYDVRSHVFDIISPQVSLDMIQGSALSIIPNSCMNGSCHRELDLYTEADVQAKLDDYNTLFGGG